MGTGSNLPVPIKKNEVLEKCEHLTARYKEVMPMCSLK